MKFAITIVVFFIIGAYVSINKNVGPSLQVNTNAEVAFHDVTLTGQLQVDGRFIRFSDKPAIAVNGIWLIDNGIDNLSLNMEGVPAGRIGDLIYSCNILLERFEFSREQRVAWLYKAVSARPEVCQVEGDSTCFDLCIQEWPGVSAYGTISGNSWYSKFDSRMQLNELKGAVCNLLRWGFSLRRDYGTLKISYHG